MEPLRLRVSAVEKTFNETVDLEKQRSPRRRTVDDPDHAGDPQRRVKAEPEAA